MSHRDAPSAVTQSSESAPFAIPAGIVAGGVALVLYVATARSFVLPGDPGEFQTLARTGGIAHSGYAPVVLLLQLFGHLPISSMAFRASLLSSVAGATAVGLAAYVATRVCGNWLASVVAALSFALGRTPWKESTEAGVHTPALLFDTTAFLFALRFVRRPDKRGAFIIGVFGGLAALSHFSAFSLVPAVIAAGVLAARAGRLRISHAAVALLGIVLGLSPIGYMIAKDRPAEPMNYIEDVLRLEPAEFIRSGPIPQTHVERVAWLLSGQQYFGYQRPAGLQKDSHLHRAVGLVGEVAMNQLPFWGSLLALWGAWTLWRRRVSGALMPAVWVLSTFLLATAVAGGWIASYFFLPGLWGLSILVAAGLADLARMRLRVAPAMAALLLLSAPFVRLSIAQPPGPLARYTMTRGTWLLWPAEWSPFRVDRSWDEYGRAVMKTLPARAAVMTWWAEGNVLRYFSIAEPLRPDVHVVHTGVHPGRVAHAVALERADGRPVFATFPPDSATPAALAFTRVASFAQTGLWRVDVVDSTAALWPGH